jgi:hypothetical protein
MIRSLRDLIQRTPLHLPCVHSAVRATPRIAPTILRYLMHMAITRITLVSLCAAVWIHAAPQNPDSLLTEALKPPPGVSRVDDGKPGAYFTTHATLGTIALTTFATSLVIGAASGNLGKLTDPNQCCPDGGNRVEPWRTTDRVLVNTGILAYLGAGGMALYNLSFGDPDRPREKHNAHRWLAAAHGTVFATSMVTGIIMARSQESNHRRFAEAARVHMASNVILVPLLSVSFANILFE